MPVWRGMSSAYIQLTDYEPGKMGIWPTFSSTTKNKKIAIQFSNTGDSTKEKILMKIYLTKKNDPISHIDCVGTKKFYDKKTGNVRKEDEYSFWPGEEEVLLFPYFGFLVVDN